MLVIGNGESRNIIDINLISCTKIGCNAIYRDFAINHLVCVDKRMMKEVLDHNVNNNSLVYTRKEWFKLFNTKRVRQVPDLPYTGSERWDDPFQWGSGPYAVLLAAKKTPNKTVNLLGFDLHSKTKKVNNVYKGTLNYDAEDKRAVDPRYWIHQIGMVFKHFPNLQFTIYQEEDWKLPTEWKYSNVKVDNISNVYYNT